MAKQSSEFLLSSLRNRILLAVAALVVFNSIFGFLGYLAVSFVISEPIYAVVSAVAAMTAATALFGWWLSNEILRPIEAVSLLARSLERSPSASLPKTTGASETDELLSSLHRNSQQLQNLIGLMDDVASGKTDAAMAPLQNPDRLSVSFQKLVSKVIESIKAKQQLDALQGSINRLRSDVSGVRSGDLSVQFRGDMWQTNEIVDSFKYVLGSLSELVRHVSSGSSATKDAAVEAKKIVRTVIEAEGGQADRLKKAASLLSESPEQFSELTEQLATAVRDVNGSLRAGEVSPVSQVETIDRLRGFVGESRKQLDLLRERTNAIPQAARRTEEIARRSNIIALNTAIQGVQVGTEQILAEEVAGLSLRAEAVHKEIVAINESLVSDLLKLEASLGAIASELPEINNVACRQADSLNDIESNVGRINAVLTALKTYAGERSTANESIVKALTTQFQGVDRVSLLKKSESNLETIINSADILRDAVADFRSVAVIPSKELSFNSSLPAPEAATPGESVLNGSDK
ncbi:MAG: hypothetical protein ABI791_07325 [Acidobacteriota bacterium]